MNQPFLTDQPHYLRYQDHDFSLNILPSMGTHWIVDPALHRQDYGWRIRQVSGLGATSDLKGGRPPAQISRGKHEMRIETSASRIAPLAVSDLISGPVCRKEGFNFYLSSRACEAI